jgi:rubrerythrin
MTIDLDFAKLSGTDVLDMAIAIEDEAEVYYEQLADWVSDGDPGVRKFFGRMAGLELRHRQQITAERERLFGDAPPSNAAKVSWAVEMPDFDKVPNDATLRQAFQVALESETRAHDFYAGALDYVDDEKIAALFEDLRKAEAQHKRLLLEEMDRYLS